MVAWTITVIPVEIILNNVPAFNITSLGLPVTSIHVERERRIFYFLVGIIEAKFCLSRLSTSLTKQLPYDVLLDFLYSLVIKWRFVSRVEDQMKKFMEVRASIMEYITYNKQWPCYQPVVK